MQYPTISKEVYDLEKNLSLPLTVCDSIFIPSFGENFKYYYFLVNFKRNNVICWSVDFSAFAAGFEQRIKFDEKIHTLPWNQKSLKSYIEILFYPHDAVYHDGKIIASSYTGNFMLSLDINGPDSYVIFDENAPTKIYSGTNSVIDNKIYFTRWDITDSLRKEKDQDFNVKLEICTYDIYNQTFKMHDEIYGQDEVHSTRITQDKENILMVAMCQKPKINYPESEPNENNCLKYKEILKSGLNSSQLITYNLNTRNPHYLELPASAAHIEFDQNESNILYIVSHNLSFNNKSIMCFGNAGLNKLVVNDGQSKILSHYEEKDFYRATSHKFLKYKNNDYLVCPCYPDQVHIINANEFIIHKKISFTPKIKEVDFEQGYHIFPNSSFDKTAYGVDVINDQPYLYVTNAWNIVIYDFEKMERIETVRYNLNKLIVSIGHPFKYKDSDTIANKKF